MTREQYNKLVEARHKLTSGFAEFQGAIQDADLIHNAECNQAMVELARAMDRAVILFGLTTTDIRWLTTGQLKVGETPNIDLIPLTD